MALNNRADSSVSPLDNLGVAAPCHISWDEMTGDERVRHCQSCKLNVYNISEMSKKEAEELISKSEGRLCVRFYKRKDGTILTDNCPIGLRALRRFVYARTAGLIAIFSGMFLTACDKEYLGSIRAPISCSTTPVVYAAKDIDAGKSIPPEALEEREILKTQLPANVCTSAALAQGKVAQHKIKAGQPIHLNDLPPNIIELHENKIYLSDDDQERLEEKAAQQHKAKWELIQSWVLEHLKK